MSKGNLRQDSNQNFILPHINNQSLNTILEKLNFDDYIIRFKKGNKIHIKKKNVGTFTKWCGGNVTSECIQKGKHSNNPKIRKKAIFAQNSRKWSKNK